jgi:hypothetical protein
MATKGDEGDHSCPMTAVLGLEKRAWWTDRDILVACGSHGMLALVFFILGEGLEYSSKVGTILDQCFKARVKNNCLCVSTLGEGPWVFATWIRVEPKERATFEAASARALTQSVYGIRAENIRACLRNKSVFQLATCLLASPPRRSWLLKMVHQQLSKA